MPMTMPAYPNIEDIPAEQAREDLENFLNQCNTTIEQNEQRFEKALKRIKVCAFLKGFLSFGLNYDKDDHFKWCPSKEWENWWQEADEF